jgi:hypothetical protein
MVDIDRAKALAALERLEAEKERRLQAKIDSGEVVSVQTTVVVGRDEDVEEATARALARHPRAADGRAVHHDLLVIVTGVPRPDPDQGEPQVQTASSEGNLSSPPEGPAGSGAGILTEPSQPTPTYVRVTIRNGDDDGDPGAIAEAYYSIEDGLLVLRDSDDRHITSRALLKGQDPAVLAKSLLREAEEPESFNHPIRYPKLGLA